MPAKTSMLHVRVDNQLKSRTAEALAGAGLTLSEAIRILLTRIVAEGGLPVALTTNPETYDAWFRAKVREALDDSRLSTPHDRVMQEIQALIDKKRRVRD